MALVRGSIDTDAERVVRKLVRHGHKAYLVGGCVRDLLLGRTPKDFDVATSATPNEIRDLFRNCRIIGRRFRLAHIFFGSKIIETSTFRANPRGDETSGESLLIRRDNVFGSDIEDALRRDFTINGLFLDVHSLDVIDHVGGEADLHARLVRTIGDPNIRFQEDPVRMLRAIKFAARLDFGIERATYDAIVRHRGEISQCAPPRVLEEFYRLLRGGAARRSMRLLTETGIDEVLSSRLAAMYRDAASSVQPLDPPLDEEEAAWHAEWESEWVGEHSEPRASALSLCFATPPEIEERRGVAWRMLDALDMLVAAGHEPNNAVLLSAITSPFLADSLADTGVRPGEASNMIAELANPLLDDLRVAKRDSERMRQVLLAQRRLAPSRRRRGRPMALARRDYFDESLLVYELTAHAAGGETGDLSFWRQIRSQSGEELGEEHDELLDGKRRRRRRGGRRRRRSPDDVDDDVMAQGEPDDDDGSDLNAALG